jgi:hypothetical protein
MVEKFIDAIDEICWRYSQQIKQEQTLDKNQLFHRLQGVRFTAKHVLSEEDWKVISDYTFEKLREMSGDE